MKKLTADELTDLVWDLSHGDDASSGLLGDLIVMYSASFLDLTGEDPVQVLSRGDFCADLQELIENAVKRRYN